jgi:hypothetical protein
MKKNKKEKKVEVKESKIAKNERKLLKKINSQNKSFVTDKAKGEKKRLKEIEKLRTTVKTEFGGYLNGHPNYSRDDEKKNSILNAIVSSVYLNETLIERDSTKNKMVLDMYYDELFLKFKEMIFKHNEMMKDDVQHLLEQTNYLKSEINELKEERSRMIESKVKH